MRSKVDGRQELLLAVARALLALALVAQLLTRWLRAARVEVRFRIVAAIATGMPRVIARPASVRHRDRLPYSRPKEQPGSTLPACSVVTVVAPRRLGRRKR